MRTVVSSDADAIVAYDCGENLTLRTARVCISNLRRMDREFMSKSWTMPAWPPTTMARASLRSTPEYAMSLNLANILCCLLDCELYTVTLAEDAAPSGTGTRPRSGGW